MTGLHISPISSPPRQGHTAPETPQVDPPARDSGRGGKIIVELVDGHLAKLAAGLEDRHRAIVREHIYFPVGIDGRCSIAVAVDAFAVQFIPALGVPAENNAVFLTQVNEAVVNKWGGDIRGALGLSPLLKGTAGANRSREARLEADDNRAVGRPHHEQIGGRDRRGDDAQMPGCSSSGN